jgi:hypothetical protein
VLITIGCTFAAVPAFGGTVYLDGWAYNLGNTPGWHGTTDEGWSGAYTATPTGVSPLADGVRFETFCVEKRVVVYVPGTYTVELNTGAVFGDGGGTGSFDALDPRTAYLYDYWLGLSNGQKSNELARDIQWAIWDIEGEWDLSTAPYAGSSMYDGARALETFADGKWSDIGNIRVANLWYTGDSQHATDVQDFLVRVPLPGSVLLGVFAVGLAGRKLRRFV